MNDLKIIDALADGLKDGGGKVFTNFPGYLSHKLFARLGESQTSINEKTAYEIAWGACYAGKRSAVMFKNVGLNDAADPFLNSMLVGVNAGLVLVVFDDVYVEGSQSRQDSRHYFDFFGGLWFEPYSIQNAYDISYKAFDLSEKFQLPIVIRITNPLTELEDEYKRQAGKSEKKEQIVDHSRYVIHPINSKKQTQDLATKNTRIQEYIDTLYGTPEKNSKKQFVSFGCCYKEEKEYLDACYKKNQYYSYPIPSNLHLNDDLVVLEQGGNYAYKKIMENSSERFQTKNNTGIMVDKSAGYIVTSNYKKLFAAIKESEVPCLVGDLGEYTKDTLDSVDAVLSFGSSVGVAIGCMMSGIKQTFAITGDASYLHSGKNAIIEAISRELPLKLIVICNGGSQGTGGQVIPGELYYQPTGVNVVIAEYYKTDEQKFTQILKGMSDSDKQSILYVQM